MKRRIVHVITGLPVGGSQMMLSKLLSAMDRESWEPEVISLRDVGEMGERIRSMGIVVRALGMRESLGDVAALPKLIGWLRDRSPHLVQTWLYHADLIGGLAAWWAGAPVIWGIRQSDLAPQDTKRSTMWIARICARLSYRIPRRIVCCSEAARRFHTAMGYAGEKMVVIPNGFDLRSFHPDPEARESVRRELGLPATAPLIGLVARFDTEKDHRTFVQAAARLHAVMPDVHFLLCGEGVDPGNPLLMQCVASAGIQSRVHLLGPRMDIPRLTASLDIATSSSYGEGFPNVVGEAMGCCVPCVVTDVGESAALVGDAGRVVPARDPMALADAWRALLEAEPATREQLGAAARRRVTKHFEIAVVTARYVELYDEVSEHTLEGRCPRLPTTPERGE
jgi:glycosyltransferase involved in cell wall biosynthesis